MIPENITREHIINAIQEIDGGKEVPYDREPHKYQIHYEGKTYPPKFIISLANRYANGIELGSNEFSGGEETNRFLVERGFEVVPIEDESTRYDDRLKEYLDSTFKVDVDKIKRSWLQFRESGIKLYVNGSKIHEKSNAGWYDLEQDIYHDLIENATSYYAVVLDDPSKTFVIPANVIKDIFGREPTIRPAEDVKRKPRWMFTLQDSSQGFTLRVSGSKKSDFVIDSYLNNWNQIPDFGSSAKPMPGVFVTGYNDVNLSHSIRFRILGWRNQSHLLSKGDYVFVYNKDSHNIQAGFKVLGRSENRSPIWEEELKSETQNIEFLDRWDAEVICDDLKIDLNTVNSFEPFSGNVVNKFIPLIGNNSPTPLSNDKYAVFRRFLLEKCEDDRVDGKADHETYWKIAPGEKASYWEEQLTNGIVAVGWNELGDLTNRDMNNIIDDIKNIWPDKYSSIVPEIKDFLSIKVGDIVIANNGISRVVGIGRISGKYQYRQNLTFHHTYPVDWFDTTERNIIPQKGTWAKTVVKVSHQLYNQIMGSGIYYLLIRHQPGHKRNKSDRKYWDDLLGKEYRYGKGVVNHKKIQPGAKTIWFYTDKDKMYFWGFGVVHEIRPTNNDEFIASYADFNYFDQGSGVEANSVVQKKIRSLDGWNPYNSIIEITEDIYNDIVGHPLQLEIFEDEPLQMPTEDEISKGYEEISKFLLIPKDKVIEILTALTSGSHVLLAGPIGTGKTRLAKMIPEAFWRNLGGYYADDYTATSDWNTQDVIGGIYPKMKGESVIYDIQYGCVVETIAKNWERELDGGRRIQYKLPQKSSPFKGVWLIIDEFNRADIDKAFGQLFTSLRTRSLKIPTNESGKSNKDLKVPQDYRIIGTLNTADKHFLFQLSDALKSRFAYILVDIPMDTESQNEIYYAVRNGISTLPVSNYDDLLLLNDEEKKVSEVTTNPEFYKRMLQAYNYLDTVRIFKRLGTAILQVIFQNMLVAMRMTRGADKSLDNALTSTLIPQLENMPLASLGACEALYNKSVVKYFKDASRSPNRQAYFVYGQYFSLYKRIVDQIHFDYPRIEHYGPSISGKINWTRTITRSPLAPPLAFSTESRKREFDTPENILLVLCAEWMHRESNRLLSIQFDEPLTEYKKELLRHIVNQTKFILQQFPIASILNSSRRYWNLSCNDHRIKTLEYETTYRLKQGLVHNANYFLLLDWIHEFRQLDMENISDSTPSRHIIEPLLNVDTIYEIWIFMEFIEFLYEKGLLIDFRFDANQYCKFEYGGNILTFWYNRQFTEADNSWIQIHTPDFTAMIGKEIIAIFDAKNYSKSSSSVPDSINKMLAYMINLDTNFGALIYPYHPKNWDDMDRSERINNTIPIVRSQNSMLNDYNINKKARDLSKLSWEQLPKEIQDKFPLHMKIFRHPRPGKAAKYHYDQTLCQIRMSPSKSEQGISMKEKSLNSIFQEIVTRLPS